MLKFATQLRCCIFQVGVGHGHIHDCLWLCGMVRTTGFSRVLPDFFEEKILRIRGENPVSSPEVAAEGLAAGLGLHLSGGSWIDACWQREGIGEGAGGAGLQWKSAAGTTVMALLQQGCWIFEAPSMQRACAFAGVIVCVCFCTGCGGSSSTDPTASQTSCIAAGTESRNCDS